MTNQTQDYTAWIGHEVVDQTGDKVGKVSTVFLDDETGRPEWLAVSTGLFAKRSSFVPLDGATVRGERLVVGWDKATVKDAPQVDDDGDGHLTPAEEQELYRYYGREQTAEAYVAPGTTTPRHRSRRAPAVTGDEAMTRSEEQVRVGTRSQEVGRARLRKYVVTETVTQTVPVSHEEVRVEREPITDADRDKTLAGTELTEAEYEMTLHAKTPVVEKTVIPVERVRLAKETVTGEQTVSTDVRKERIEEEISDNTKH
jgi:uncharacterized protein (TIGR02271 family)